NIPGRVLVAVQHQATGGAAMGAHAQTLRDALPAATTVLAGVGRRGGHHLLASVCCFVGQDWRELPPAGITDALAYGAAAHHVGDAQVYEREDIILDDIILTAQCQGRLVVKVAALPPHLQVLLGDQPARLLAPFAPLPPPSEALLRFGELLLRFAGVAWVL